MNNNCLQHYGVLGMKWGKRQGKNKHESSNNIQTKKRNSDVIVKQGTSFQHITDNPRLRLNKNKTYLSSNEWDKAVYQGQYAVELARRKRTNNIYNYSYTAKHDLISPSQEKRVDMFVDMYKKNPIRVGKDLTKASKMLNAQNADSAWSIKNYKHVTDDEIRKGYDLFTAIYGTQRMFGKSYSYKKYHNNLLNMGYDALIDDNDRGRYYAVVEPLIVLNGKRSLTKLNSYKMSEEEIIKNARKTENSKSSK